MSTFVGEVDGTTLDWEVVAAVGMPGVRVTNKKDGRSCSQPENPTGPAFSESRWTMLNERIKYRSSDVLVMTFPKCGTTWIEQVTLLLLHGGDESCLNPATKNTYVPGSGSVGKIWPEACVEQAASFQGRGEFSPITFQDFDDAPSPRVLKSHAPLQKMVGVQEMGVKGLPEGTKVVVVSRNPFDACVSGYYHAWNPYKCGWPFAAWAAVWLSGKTPAGDWCSWTKNWFSEAKSHPDRVCWIQFEDLKTQPVETVQRLADFLGVGDDAALVQAAVEGSRFERMKEQAVQSGDDKIGHLRKGVAGDWRNHFSESLVREFKEYFYEGCAGTGLVFSLGPGEEDLVAP